MRPGYLLRNGVPYSAATVMTEYWNVFREPDGTDWLVIAARITDPANLRQPYQTTPAFKREPDGSKWDPSPCAARATSLHLCRTGRHSSPAREDVSELLASL